MLVTTDRVFVVLMATWRLLLALVVIVLCACGNNKLPNGEDLSKIHVTGTVVPNSISRIAGGISISVVNGTKYDVSDFGGSFSWRDESGKVFRGEWSSRIDAEKLIPGAVLQMGTHVDCGSGASRDSWTSSNIKIVNVEVEWARMNGYRVTKMTK